MKLRYLLTFILFLIVSKFTFAQENILHKDTTLNIDTVPNITINDFSVSYAKRELIITTSKTNGKATININGEDKVFLFKDGQANRSYDITTGQLLLLKAGRTYQQHRLIHISPLSAGGHRFRNIPLWLSVVPPLMAILLALIFKEVLIALFVGIWSGAFIAHGLRFDPLSIVNSFLEVISKYILDALNNSGHLSVMVFSLLVGGMVAVISRNGGMAGVVKQLSRLAKDAKSTQFVTWLLGIAIFFDDYANTLIVGNTMRPVSDRFKISREKLAYIVDSTAAPVVAVAFITTWIGVELSYIKNNMVNLPNLDTIPSAYSVFLSSLQYSFYPFLTLGFVLFIIFTKRDFGPMLKAEQRARAGQVRNKIGTKTVNTTNDLAPVQGAPLSWYNAAIPVLAVIIVTVLGLVSTGTEACYAALLEKGARITSDDWLEVWSWLHLLSDADEVGFLEQFGILIGNADSYVALLWASLSGLFFAIALTLGGGIMKVTDTMHTVTDGFNTMLPALAILVAAWALGDVTNQLQTATFFTTILQDAINPYLLPGVIFLLAGAIAFSTGSSWSTMAILYPIAIPATWAICQSNGLDVDTSMAILYNVIATVLAASVFGDHCSPISDTTILSSLATDCNHIDHVRTQLPYALSVGIVSLILGILSTMLGTPALLNFGVGFLVLFLVVQVFGKQVDSSI